MRLLWWHGWLCYTGVTRLPEKAWPEFVPFLRFDQEIWTVNRLRRGDLRPELAPPRVVEAAKPPITVTRPQRAKSRETGQDPNTGMFGNTSSHPDHKTVTDPPVLRKAL
jgi:hypothetical protein